MPIKALDTSKPILGYTLKERIGAGGYGEVWTAVAPGGMLKAVKFVFGYHDENRAQTELKSLNRVKELRHPFLLSLERIDVVDGQLVVITELADMCLKTRFEQCVESGLKGIPRPELMNYLRDAADALDYISDDHRLQHLDVKPENLLLVSGHVKVADYGLVKDIHDGTQSLMAGLTPAYAPPELFDGRPSNHSDQYSLAIVFQEMLTGARPFDGATAAQLASQHMHDRPHLKVLPRDDQAVISRALSKDPELRYPSCRAMIDELNQQSGRRNLKPKTPKRRKPESRTDTVTTEGTIQLTEGTMPFAMRPVEVERLGTLEWSSADARTRPTLLIGLGNTGTQVLWNLRQKLVQRFGDMDRLPSLKLLCIDTDTRDLAAACRQDGKESLALADTLDVPLRRPEEYRSDASMHLNWLSRRWIYNVPRSLQTEGIRPLGRLAYADHQEQILIRLRQRLSDILREESLAETAETIELEPDMQPRIILIGSISGGTCSGMALDIVYSVRAILQELGASDEDVTGIFTHSTVRSGPERELTIANSLAFLSELYHFSCVEGYPGDEHFLPAFDDERPTMSNTYVVHLGDDLTQSDYEQKIEALSEYLCLTVATEGSAYVESCRTEQPEQGLSIRTLGLSLTTKNLDHLIESSSELLCQHLAQSWLHGDESGGGNSFDEKDFAEKHLRATNISVEGFAQSLLEWLMLTYDQPLNSLVAELSHWQDGDRSDNLSRVQDTIKEFFDTAVCGARDPSRSWESFVTWTTQQRRAKFADLILALVDLPGYRVAAARSACNAIQERMQRLRSQAGVSMSSSIQRIAAIEAALPEESTREQWMQVATDYAQTQLQCFTFGRVRQLIDELLPCVDLVEQQLDALTEKIEEVAAVDDSTETLIADDTHTPVGRLHVRLREYLQGRVPKLVDRVDQQLQLLWFAHNGGLRHTLVDYDALCSLRQQLELAARQTIVSVLGEVDMGQFITDSAELEKLVKQLRNSAVPSFMTCGGKARLALFQPVRGKADFAVEELTRTAKQPSALVPATIGQLMACYEIGCVPVNNVAMHMLQDRPDSIELASRLHVRNDISWSPVTSIR